MSKSTGKLLAATLYSFSKDCFLYPLLSSSRTGEMNLQTNHKKWKPKPLEKFHEYAATTAVVFCCQVCVYQSQKCFNPIQGPSRQQQCSSQEAR
jgi:hypothetical protein